MPSPSTERHELPSPAGSGFLATIVMLTFVLKTIDQGAAYQPADLFCPRRQTLPLRRRS
jgi:hypothetical protein